MLIGSQEQNRPCPIIMLEDDPAIARHIYYCKWGSITILILIALGVIFKKRGMNYVLGLAILFAIFLAVFLVVNIKPGIM